MKRIMIEVPEVLHEFSNYDKQHLKRLEDHMQVCKLIYEAVEDIKAITNAKKSITHAINVVAGIDPGE